jgi:hypothetical protein
MTRENYGTKEKKKGELAECALILAASDRTSSGPRLARWNLKYPSSHPAPAARKPRRAVPVRIGVGKLNPLTTPNLKMGHCSRPKAISFRAATYCSQYLEHVNPIVTSTF